MLVHTYASAGLNIRSGPGTGYSVIRVVRIADQLTIADSDAVYLRKAVWIRVSFLGISGWAYAYYLTKTTQAPPTPVPTPIPNTFPYFGLRGLHGPADPGLWPWDDQIYNDIRLAKIQAVKLLSAADMDGRVVSRLNDSGVKLIMARLFAKIPVPTTPAEFVIEIRDATARLYNAGVRYFEVHNEPNLHTKDSPEGMWVQWQNGYEFGKFFSQVVSLLKPLFPQIRLGFPGLSPGGDISFVRYDSQRFLSEADSVVRSADFVCMHTYWNEQAGLGLENSLTDIRNFASRYSNKMIFVTEFSNSSIYTGKDTKGQQYLTFYNKLLSLPKNVGAAFSYVYSSSGGYQAETWRNSPIPAILSLY